MMVQMISLLRSIFRCFPPFPGVYHHGPPVVPRDSTGAAGRHENASEKAAEIAGKAAAQAELDLNEAKDDASEAEKVQFHGSPPVEISMILVV